MSKPKLFVRVERVPALRVPTFALSGVYLMVVAKGRDWDVPDVQPLADGRLGIEVPLQAVAAIPKVVTRWLHGLVTTLPMSGALLVLAQPRSGKNLGLGLAYWPGATKPEWRKLGCFPVDKAAPVISRFLFPPIPLAPPPREPSEDITL